MRVRTRATRWSLPGSRRASAPTLMRVKNNLMHLRGYEACTIAIGSSVKSYCLQLD
jgi:hypothetical protein